MSLRTALQAAESWVGSVAYETYQRWALQAAADTDLHWGFVFLLIK